MRRLLPLLPAALSLVLFTGAGQQAPQRMYQAYSAEQVAQLDKISAYMNSIHTLRSNFVQIGPDGGTDQGQVYIDKPGRIRFSYNLPNPLLIVATNGRVYVKNSRLNTVDRADLSDTPLGLLLNERVDLKTNKAVIGVAEREGNIVVRARSSSNRNDSNITLVFALPGLELRQWMVKDNQGGNTTVALQSLQTGVSIDPSLFAVPQKTVKQSSRQ